MLFKVTLVEELFDPTIEGSLLRVTSLGRLYFDPIISKGTHYPNLMTTSHFPLHGFLMLPRHKTKIPGCLLTVFSVRLSVVMIPVLKG